MKKIVYALFALIWASASVVQAAVTPVSSLGAEKGIPRKTEVMTTSPLIPTPTHISPFPFLRTACPW